MAKVRLHAYKIHEVTSYTDSRGEPVKLISIEIGLGKGPPIADKVIEARKVSEIEAALVEYATAARATGMQLQCHASIVRGERKPAGFDKANLKIDIV
jgi:hypothetical protein